MVGRGIEGEERGLMLLFPLRFRSSSTVVYLLHNSPYSVHF